MRIHQYDNLTLKHATRAARIFRAVEDGDGRRVIVKLANEGPGPTSLLRHDYQLAEQHPAPWRLRPLAWQEHGNALMAVFEDPGGRSLHDLAQDPAWSLVERLEAALALVQVLVGIHGEGLIHKDISPPNLLFDLRERTVKVLDFALATRLSREEASLTNFGMVDGNPAYCAPEQTGRMNRNIDQRSDFYALGATLYYLFTGFPPFPATAALELLHAQIAITPEPPVKRQPSLPDVLSQVILKLLQKAPEHRYQSLDGLKSDLRRITTGLTDAGEVADFVIAADDHAAEFQLPRALFGREQARNQLMSCFEETTRGHETISMVAGPSGIGKTALIRELYRPITAHQAFFVSGKFDLLQRDRPYTALVEALQQLFRDILAEPEERLEFWRQGLQNAVGDNGGVVTQLIPELEWILGPQGVMENLQADESSRVFTRILLRIIGLFCSGDRPLVIYLDDLQWADRASLSLLKRLFLELAAQPLYFIGAYRDNEVDQSHPLADLLRQLADGHGHYHHTTLEPLNEADITDFLGATLAQPAGQVADLARAIQRKTGGVPFFIHQFLDSLCRSGLILPQPSRQGWTIDPASLDALPATENQVDWMATQIRRFDPKSRELLKSAACMGNQFDLYWLARLDQSALEGVLARLQAPLDAGLITVLRQARPVPGDTGNTASPSGQSLSGRFAHDRIQQAAYSLMTGHERQQRHWQIGKLLLREIPETGREPWLFDIIHHLNLGRPGDCDQDLCLQIARLNLRAGLKAHQSAAYTASFRFLMQGIDALPGGAWQQHYDLTLALHSHAMEAAFLSKQFAAMDRLGDLVLNQARALLDTRMVYPVRIQACNVQNKPEEAIDQGLAFLRRLGVRFPARPATGHILLSLTQTQLQLRNKSIASIRAIPEMTDPAQLVIMDTIHRVASSAYFAAPKLHPLLALKMVRLAARYGHAPAYTIPYAAYGIVLCGVLHDYERGFEFGELSLEYANHPGARPLKCRTQVLVHTFIWHWTRYAGESVDSFRQSYHEGLETGDHEYAAYACVLESVSSLFIGRHLDDVAELFQRYAPVVSRLSASTAYTFLRVHAQMVANFREPMAEPWRLKGLYADEDTLAPECGQDQTGLCCLRIGQLVMRYRFGQLAEASDLLEQADQLADAARAMLISADHHFYGGLIRAALWRKAGGSNRKLRRAMALHRKRLRNWAMAAPVNFNHKSELLEAEWLRARGDNTTTLHHYEKAISLARDSGFIHDQALAEELAGDYCREQGLNRIAWGLHEDARNHYQQWGAAGLAERLTERARQEAGNTRSWDNPEIDLAAFKATLKAISGAQIHSKMMDAVIRGAVTYAGAQSGQLLLARPDGQFCVETCWRVNDEQPVIFQGTALDQATDLIHAVVHYVARSRKTLVIDDAQKPQSLLPSLFRDASVSERRVRSILCVPLASGPDDSVLTGILYLENNATAGAFTNERLDTLEILCLTAAGRLELSRRAVTDGLTRLYNHEYFQQMLVTEIHLARRKERPLSLIMLDVDHFKAFNDQWGHQFGDEVLAGIARTLQETARGSDVVARYGGEEFAIILPETSLDQALDAAERVRVAVANSRFYHQSQIVEVTISLGVAGLGPALTDSDALIRQADTMLYQAKRSGRNCIR